MAGADMGKRWSRETISRGALSDRRTGRGRGYESHGRGRGREQTGRDRGRDHGHGGRGGQTTVGDRDGLLVHLMHKQTHARALFV